MNPLEKKFKELRKLAKNSNYNDENKCRLHLLFDEPHMHLKQQQQETQKEILDHLVTMDKFRQDKLLTLSVFRATFERYLTDDLEVLSQERTIMRTWDNLKESERRDIANAFLKAP